jgi:hypothetical protein
MMFSGAQPTIPQLAGNPLLGETFAKYFTAISYSRFAIQYFYVTELVFYTKNLASASLLYGFEDWFQGVCLAVIIGYFVLFRLVCYLILVFREHR